MSAKRWVTWLERHHRALVVCAVAGLWVAQWHHSLGRPRDFIAYYTTGARILSGAPIYDFGDDPLLCYKYSPLFAFFLAPFALLPLPAAQSCWFALNALLTFALLGLSYRTMARPDPRSDRAFWPLVAVFALSARYALLNATSGQVVALLLVLAVAGILAFDRGRPWLGGALLSLAVMIKIMPVLLLGWLALRRNWKGIAVTAAWCAVWVLLPSLHFGFARNASLHAEWLDFVQQQNTFEQLTRPQNQSVLALLTRLAVRTPYGMNLVDVPLRTVTSLYPVILFGGFLALLGGLFAWIERADGGERDERARASLGVVLVYMTAVSPLAWRYNFLSLMVVHAFTVGRLARSRRWDRRVVALLAASFAVATFAHGDVLGAPLDRWSHLLGIEMWGGWAAALACVLAARPLAGEAEQVAVPARAAGSAG
jgi:hypothetical protein